MMLRTASFLSFVALSLALGGCSGGADVADPGDDVSTSGDAEEALSSARRHVAPVSAELRWRPGCGMRMPDGRVCYMGLELAFTKQSADLKVSTRTTVNNTKKTLTVKLDTWSDGSAPSPAPVEEETKLLGSPARMQFATYQAKVVDFHGNELWSGAIHPMPAP